MEFVYIVHCNGWYSHAVCGVYKTLEDARQALSNSEGNGFSEIVGNDYPIDMDEDFAIVAYPIGTELCNELETESDGFSCRPE